MNKKFVLALAVTVLLTACDNPKSTVIPANVSEWGDSFKAEMAKLSPSDKDTLEKYLIRTQASSFLGGSGMPPGETIGKAIDDQHAFEIEQAKQAAAAAALKAQVEKKRADIIRKVNGMLTASIIKVDLVSGDQYNFSHKLDIVVALKNLSQRKIDGVEGTFKFYDMFGSKIAEVSFKDEQGIMPGEISEWDGVKDYNEFLDNDKALANLVPGKYKAVFYPKAIVVDNGAGAKPDVLRVPDGIDN